MTMLASWRRLLPVLVIGAFAGAVAAQVEIKPVKPLAGQRDVPAAPDASATPVDLGEGTGQKSSQSGELVMSQAGMAGSTKAKASKPGKAAASGRSPLASSGSPQQAEHVEFRDRPVPVSLGVGKERMVLFPGPVKIEVPGTAGGMLDVQVIGRTAYITALAPLSKVRLAAQDLTIDQRWYPLDIVASAEAPAGLPIEIHPADSATDSASAEAGLDAPDMVSLTRFAAHMLYAPRRLMPATPGVRQVPVVTAPVPGLYRGRRIQTTPIGAWRGGALYVTAVRFTNLEPMPVELDLDELRGQWLAATAQHLRLGAAGTEADTTSVYLICDKPFEACR